jgi:arsenate reductase (glutaredoxin)
MTVTIYHNPRCSKSRETLELIRSKGIEPEVVLYLETPPDYETLDHLLSVMGRQPREAMRTKEAPYRELGLSDPGTTREALIEAMVNHPVLIERPIVVNGDKAAMGRPPEAVLGIL